MVALTIRASLAIRMGSRRWAVASNWLRSMVTVIGVGAPFLSVEESPHVSPDALQFYVVPLRVRRAASLRRMEPVGAPSPSGRFPSFRSGRRIVRAPGGHHRGPELD